MLRTQPPSPQETLACEVLLLLSRTGDGMPPPRSPLQAVAESGSPWSESKKRTIDETSGKHEREPQLSERQLDYQTIQPYFQFSMGDAAESLGISLLSLRQHCQRLGITAWPSSKAQNQGTVSGRQDILSNSSIRSHGAKLASSTATNTAGPTNSYGLKPERNSTGNRHRQSSNLAESHQARDAVPDPATRPHHPYIAIPPSHYERPLTTEEVVENMYNAQYYNDVSAFSRMRAESDGQESAMLRMPQITPQYQAMYSYPSYPYTEDPSYYGYIPSAASYHHQYSVVPGNGYPQPQQPDGSATTRRSFASYPQDYDGSPSYPMW